MTDYTFRRVFQTSKWASSATRRIDRSLVEHFGPGATLWRAWKCCPPHPWEVRIGDECYPQRSGSAVKDWIIEERRHRARRESA